jgi:hypothetical protein
MTPIKGSWEEKLISGQQLLARQKDEGIALLADLIDRLHSLPKTQRLAASGRLEQILVVAIADLVPYLTYREHYDRAIHYVMVAEELATPEERKLWQFHRSSILIVAEKFEECLDLMQTITRDDGLRNWCYFTLEAARQGRADIVEAVCSDLEQTANRIRASAADPTGLRPLNSVYGYTKAIAAVAQSDLQGATAWMEFSLANDDGQNPYDLTRFYTHLIEQGHLAAARTWIQRDPAHPQGSHFWKGFAEHHLGRHAEARKHWQQERAIPQSNSANAERLSGTELVLSLYYLGDEDGAGLGVVLNSLNGDGPFSPAQFYLAGLGWAMRGDRSAAHSNFQLAYTRAKSIAMSKALPIIWWRFCQDLLPAETLADYARYFVQQPAAAAPAAANE